jgi:hypothetical protein
MLPTAANVVLHHQQDLLDTGDSMLLLLPPFTTTHTGDGWSSLFPNGNAATSVSGVLVKSTDSGDNWSPPVIINAQVSIIW